MVINQKRRGKSDGPSPAARFPLLNECFRSAHESIGLFPVLKDWDKKKIKALLAEIDAADRLSDETYGELACRAENFFSKANSRALDEARMEVGLILSEIAAVALCFLGDSA